MAVTRNEIELDIRIGQRNVEQGSEFKYLGVIIHEKGDQEQDISGRIRAANKVYYALGARILKNKEIRRDTKLRISKAA